MTWIWDLGGIGSATCSVNLSWTSVFPDLTQGKAVINKKNLQVESPKRSATRGVFEVIYDEEICEVIYDKEINEAIYVQFPVDDNGATVEEGQDKWGNVCVLYYSCHIDNDLSS